MIITRSPLPDPQTVLVLSAFTIMPSGYFSRCCKVLQAVNASPATLTAPVPKPDTQAIKSRFNGLIEVESIMESKSAFAAVIDIVVAPAKALRGVDSHKGWTWLAFLLYVGSGVAFSFYYYMGSGEWAMIKAQIMAPMADKGPEAIKQTSELLTPMRMAVTAAVGLLVISPILFALHGAYLNMVTKSDESNTHNFGDWFALAVWARIPELLNYVILIALALASSLPGPTELNILSLNTVLGLPMTSHWSSLTNTLSLFTLWGMGLTQLGIRKWTNIPSGQAWFAAAAPYVIIFGGWAVINLFIGN
ncbi:YIP1 family protein [Gallaecimonas sp. GXIMD1310]|uniref:YIP1 family protein n=1 Tax=Gallaecimonas sp. GXIMD1310 TaxID=3131926 RepID=UPI003253E91D